VPRSGGGGDRNLRRIRDVFFASVAKSSVVVVVVVVAGRRERYPDESES
jgi:hypothetical protein